MGYHPTIDSIFYGRHSSGHIILSHPDAYVGRHRRAEWDLDVDEHPSTPDRVESA